MGTDQWLQNVCSMRWRQGFEAGCLTGWRDHCCSMVAGTLHAWSTYLMAWPCLPRHGCRVGGYGAAKSSWLHKLTQHTVKQVRPAALHAQSSNISRLKGPYVCRAACIVFKSHYCSAQAVASNSSDVVRCRCREQHAHPRRQTITCLLVMLLQVSWHSGSS